MSGTKTLRARSDLPAKERWCDRNKLVMCLGRSHCRVLHPSYGSTLFDRLLVVPRGLTKVYFYPIMYVSSHWKMCPLVMLCCFVCHTARSCIPDIQLLFEHSISFIPCNSCTPGSMLVGCTLHGILGVDNGRAYQYAEKKTLWLHDGFIPMLN